MTEDLRMMALRIKNLRELANESVADIAGKTGVSEQIYLTYESGESDIPASFLYALSRIYHVDMAVLLTGEEAHMKSYFVVRKGKGASVNRRKDYEYENLAYGFADKKMEPFLVTVPAGEGAGNQYAHEGQEFIHIMEGTLEVSIGQYDKITLHTGDSLYFNSGKPHGLRAANNAPARFLSVIVQ